ncbi:Hypothetical_protein [Hexamita inflata]|uniref:Hypothetical_protein n=1 Tax=Hexamita inflata TaxID=28002 RepID=A0AA86R969_9EUKA|nr:Hypothetical protein HINF_LOCUS51505 [Hexamita inflata]
MIPTAPLEYLLPTIFSTIFELFIQANMTKQKEVICSRYMNLQEFKIINILFKVAKCPKCEVRYLFLKYETNEETYYITLLVRELPFSVGKQYSRPIQISRVFFTFSYHVHLPDKIFVETIPQYSIMGLLHDGIFMFLASNILC